MEFTETSLVSVRRPSLRDTVRLSLEQAILDGNLRGGQRLNEVELAQKLGVSRGVVREVIREMEAGGILVSIPYKGTFVKEWSPKNVTELYTLRAVLEEYAVELATARVTDEDVAGLEATLGAMHAAARAGDPAQLVNLDMQFHRRLAMLAGHSLLLHFLDDISAQTHLFIVATKAVYHFFPTLEDAASSHDAILAAIRCRDAPAARAAMRRHIYEMGDRLVDALAQTDAA